MKKLISGVAAAAMLVGGIAFTTGAASAGAPPTDQPDTCYETVVVTTYKSKKAIYKQVPWVTYQKQEWVPKVKEVSHKEYRWVKITPEVQEQSHQEWRWLREHKDIQVPESQNGNSVINWLDRIGVPNAVLGGWYALPQSVIDAANFDPRSVSPTGTVNVSVYGGPSQTVNYKFVIDGPSDFTTGPSPYGGGVKVDTKTVIDVEYQAEITEWHPSVDGHTAIRPVGDEWNPVDFIKVIDVAAADGYWVDFDLKGFSPTGKLVPGEKINTGLGFKVKPNETFTHKGVKYRYVHLDEGTDSVFVKHVYKISDEQPVDPWKLVKIIETPVEQPVECPPPPTTEPPTETTDPPPTETTEPEPTTAPPTTVPPTTVPGTLPDTGSTTGPIVALAAALMALGVGAAGIARKRS